MADLTTQPVSSRRSLLRVICPAYPAFNIYSRPARVMTALGPVCVATAVHDLPGWDAEIIDENNYRRGPTDDTDRPDHAQLQRSRPARAVGLYGGLTSTIPRLLQLAAAYRAMGAITIAGGQHFVSDNVEHALRRGVDIVVLGEGEQTITQLLERIGRDVDWRDVAGIAFLDADRLVVNPARPPITDFDALPLPDFGLLRNATLRIYPVSATRGCAMTCEFCSVRGKPRFATLDRMMEQFASIHERYGGRTFFIVDDLFGQNRAATLELCRRLRDYQRQRAVRFSITVQIRLDRARDDQLLAAMREAGVRVLAIGFESPIAEELEAMHKRLKPQDMLALVRRYRQAGFRIHGMFIFGYPQPPGVTFAMPAAERVRHFRRFIRRARLDTVQVLLPIPLPGTALTARLAAQDRIFSTDHVGLEYYDGNFPVMEPDPPLTPLDMQAAARRIMGHVYHPGALLRVGLNILCLPAIALRLHRAREGWQNWHRRWRSNLHRAGGWLLMRRWAAATRTDPFAQKLRQARAMLRGGSGVTS